MSAEAEESGQPDPDDELHEEVKPSVVKFTASKLVRDRRGGREGWAGARGGESSIGKSACTSASVRVSSIGRERDISPVVHEPSALEKMEILSGG